MSKMWDDVSANITIYDERLVPSSLTKVSLEKWQSYKSLPCDSQPHNNPLRNAYLDLAPKDQSINTQI